MGKIKRQEPGRLAIPIWKSEHARTQVALLRFEIERERHSENQHEFVQHPAFFRASPARSRHAQGNGGARADVSNRFLRRGGPTRKK
jgi:hypothetical protein